jgi:hypothetical protein
LTMSEFNNYFRAVFPTNDFEVGIVFEWSGISYGNSQSDSNKKQYWHETKDSSVCLEKNLTTESIEVVSCIRYINWVPQTYWDFIFEWHFYKDYSYRIWKSYKFDQSQKYPNRESQKFVSLAKKYFNI